MPQSFSLDRAAEAGASTGSAGAESGQAPVQETVEYTYGDSQWLDLLTAYNGSEITYDAIGNPLQWYDGTVFTWVNGRRLSSAVNSETGLNLAFTYDSDGLRLTKTVGDTEHKYIWQGSQLVSEYYDGTELEFFYDESGSPYAFSYKADTADSPVFYYYLTNLQGDVTAILDADGNIVAGYTYDAWGKLLSSTGDLADVNPIRYRGYYYDAELEMYYLKSRYYDPEICRWINVDDASNLGANSDFASVNLFAYCGNNPVNRADDGGEFWHIAVGAVVGGLIGMGVQAISNLTSGEDVSKGLGTAFLTGAASGALAATGVGMLGSIVGNAAISMAGNAMNQVINNKGFDNFDVADMLIDGLIGGISGAVGGRGMGKSANISTLNKRLLGKVLSGDVGIARQGVKYYVSQTSHEYWKYLIKPVLYSGATAASGQVVKNISMRL